MKIAVVGCGAVGSFYGGNLARAGHEVHFLLRSDYEVVRQKGVRVRTGLSEFVVRPHCAVEPEQIGHAEVVLVGLKTTANDQFGSLLSPLVRAETAIVTLQNGLGNEEQLAQLFPARQILGGLCFVCLNRLEPGVVQHFDHGSVILGEFDRGPKGRTHELASHFCDSGVPCSVTQNLAQAHWEKLAWNIPFNGLGVAGAAGYEALTGGQSSSLASPASTSAPCLTTDRLLSDPRWLQLVRELILEVVSAARAMGFNLMESLVEEQIERTRTMGAYKASTLIDFERGQALELQSLFLEPLRQAREAGVATPRLEALCKVLKRLDPGGVP
ncbi:MAG: 2-dehydropantoate 2-reductase [Verrucomicrobia bacterium]|nr:MAG: 2-dehydropantoate 2-reductase [Verrucomicrobiota bacterium]